ncbi:MAG: hypothetical protein Q8936_16610 [Bacillota bacterium]|nr:hypothetical protein [Bacillota bacterium]
MGKLKKLRMKHMLLLEKYGYDIFDFIYVKHDSESYTFQQKSTGKEITLRY